MASEPVLAGEQSPEPDIGRERGRGPMRRLAYALLVAECLVILVPSIYGRLTPKLFGIPFFYWFQLLWILVAMAVTGVVYLLTTSRTGTAPQKTTVPSQRSERGGVN